MQQRRILQIVALIGMHVLAVIYNAEWIAIVIGADLILLGITIKAIDNQLGP